MLFGFTSSVLYDEKTSDDGRTRKCKWDDVLSPLDTGTAVP